MERKEYLEICQRNAALNRKEKVYYKGHAYIPKEFVMWFDRNGKTVNSAVLIDIKTKCEIRCDLRKVEKTDGSSLQQMP